MQDPEMVQYQESLIAVSLVDPERGSLHREVRRQRVDPGQEQKLSEIFCQMLMVAVKCFQECSHRERMDSGQDWRATSHAQGMYLRAAIFNAVSFLDK